MAALVACGALLPSTARAFSLSDHAQLTRVAVLEHNRCLPDVKILPDEYRVLQQANANQDLDLVDKWRTHSHYFNPHHPLKMRRADSWLKVEREAWRARLLAAADAARYRLEIAAAAGAIIHHLQDMASPLHVLPVEHGLGDGFESFESQVMPEPRLELAEDCAALAGEGATDPLDLLQQTAMESFERVARARFELTDEAGHLAEVVDGFAFWRPGRQERFGSYGELGNVFGKPVVLRPAGKRRVARSEYERFKNGALRLALDATRKLLRWTRVGALEPTPPRHDRLGEQRDSRGPRRGD